MRFGAYGTLAALLALPVQPVAAQTTTQTATQTATLVVHVEKTVAGGILRLGLYDAAGYPDDDAKPVASADVPAQAGRTSVTLTGLAPGTYAIQAYQDRNGNGKMDSSWLGLPLEPYGFSRDATPRLSKPGFDRVKFAVTAGANSQTFSLQNTGSPQNTGGR